jgi:hypothetical protein
MNQTSHISEYLIFSVSVGETDLDETFYTAANMCGISLNSDGL